MKKIKSLSILIIAAMLLALICPITSNAATTIQFEDSELAGQVQKFLGDKATISGSTVTITDESVLANTSTQLDVVLSNCKSLKGLETFMQKASKVEGVRFQLNAENFNLDLSPLKSATNLKHLTISGSNKTTTLNISGLSGLTKVETLVMSHVSIDQKVVEEISNMKGLKSSTGSVWNSKKVFINYSSNIICTTSETADSNGNVKISLPRYLVDPIRYHKDHKDIFTTDNGISCEVVPTDKATLTIVDDDKNPSVTVTAPLKELQSGNVKIKIAGLGSIASLTDRPISDSTISFKYLKTAFNLKPGFSDRYLHIEKLNDKVANILNLNPGDPAMVVLEQIYLPSGVLFNASKLVYNYKNTQFFLQSSYEKLIYSDTAYNYILL